MGKVTVVKHARKRKNTNLFGEGELTTEDKEGLKSLIGGYISEKDSLKVVEDAKLDA